MCRRVHSGEYSFAKVINGLLCGFNCRLSNVGLKPTKVLWNGALAAASPKVASRKIEEQEAVFFQCMAFMLLRYVAMHDVVPEIPEGHQTRP